MTRLVVESHVGADGVLRLSVPVGIVEANHAVKVTIEPLPNSDTQQAQYASWLDHISGKWQGEFERLPTGEFESRDPL